MSAQHTHQPSSEMPEWLPRATVTVLVTILIFIAAIGLVRTLRDLISWIVISLFLSFALEPLTNRLEKRGWKRGLATGIVLTITFLVFMLFVGSMVPLIIAQMKELIQDAPKFVTQIGDFLYSKFGITISTGDIIKRITEKGSAFGLDGTNVASNVLGVGGRVIGGVFQTFTIILFTFYLVADGPKVRRKVMTLMPPKQQKFLLETWEVAIEKMGGYLYVRLILAGLTAVTAFIVMTITKVPFALPLALWMGIIAQFIPVIGTYIAVTVPLLVAVLERPWSALVLLIYVIVYQQIENYIISPKLTAKTMQLHPAIAIGSAIAGGTLYGPVGAFLALPAAAILQAVVGSYMQRHEVIDESNYLLGVQKTPRPKSK